MWPLYELDQLFFLVLTSPLTFCSKKKKHKDKKRKRDDEEEKPDIVGMFFLSSALFMKVIKVFDYFCMIYRLLIVAMSVSAVLISQKAPKC